ncbi:MAG: hypothetical protein ACI80S_000947 [Pseudohongiellaceae bacterium]|jgi:hypothetical protein
MKKMKKLLQKIFSPLLLKLESSKGKYSYRRSHRIILIVVGSLFSFLTAGVLAVGVNTDGWGFLFPSVIFGVVGLTCIVIASLGSDRAVARVWSSSQ